MHTGLQAISTSARKHLVDTQDLEWVWAHADVEKILSSIGHHVLIGSNTCCLQSLTGDLLLLVGHHVGNRWEVLTWNLLLSTLPPTHIRSGALPVRVESRSLFRM